MSAQPLEGEPSNVIRDISPRDSMYDGDEAAYFESGRSALACIRQAMLAVGKQDVSSILDLPCGYGRVGRTLRAAFEDAELIACDIDREGVDYCVQVLGATPVYSGYSPGEIEIPHEVDLIWCGSLLTHLDSFRWQGFLSLFARSLAEGGVLAFTTHGREAAERLRDLTMTDFSRPVENMIADYETYGFAYSDYYESPREYGVSLSSPAWVRGELEKLPRLRLVSHTEAAWHAHQDVVVCTPA